MCLQQRQEDEALLWTEEANGMMGRIGFLAILLTSLSGAAFQFAPNFQRRPTLMVFKELHCPPCKAWVAAYDNKADPRLRNSINRDWRMEVYFASQRPDLVQRYNVRTVPTFLLLDQNCREIRRVEGFPGAEQLYLQLVGKRSRNSQPELLVRKKPLVAPDPEDRRRDEQLRAENAELQRQVRESTAVIDSLTGDLTHAQEIQKQQAETLRQQQQRELEQLREQIRMLTNPEVEEPSIAQTDRPPDHSRQGWETEHGAPSTGEEALPDWFQEVPVENWATPEPNISAEMSQPSSGLFWSLVKVGVAKLAEYGVHEGLAQVAVPTVLGGGPLGVAGIVGWQVFKWWRRRRRSQEDEVRESHPDPQRTVRGEKIIRRTLTEDGRSTEESLWRDGVRLALEGQLPVLGAEQVGQAIEKFVYSREAQKRGTYLERGSTDE